MKKPLTKVNGFLVAGTGLEPVTLQAYFTAVDKDCVFVYA